MTVKEKKGKAPGRKRLIIIAAALVIAAGAVLCVGILTASRSGIVEERSVLYLAEATPYEALVDSLESGGRITNAARFRQFAQLMKMGDTVRAGRYELRPGMSARQVVGMFRSGSQVPLRVTFNNIRTFEDFAGRLGGQLRADSAEFLAAFREESTPVRYGFTRDNFIAMFIPNTYEFYWTITPEAFIDRMAREYDRFWNDSREGKLARTGLTRAGVSSLAAIVEEETNVADEMPTIAGVYVNRLKKGMLLQADPTVKYAAGDMTLRRVLNKHLKIDSPYNTYIYTGVPPGPIRMPSVQAIDAVLNYQQTDYLYFCAKSDFSGRHAFAKTLAEHNRNARAYSGALDRAGIR